MARSIFCSLESWWSNFSGSGTVNLPCITVKSESRHNTTDGLFQTSVLKEAAMHDFFLEGTFPFQQCFTVKSSAFLRIDDTLEIITQSRTLRRDNTPREILAGIWHKTGFLETDKQFRDCE